MIVEERVYRLHAKKVPEFLRIYEEYGFSVHTKILGNLIGYFTTDVGHLNQVVHLWGYKSHDDRARRRRNHGAQGSLGRVIGWRGASAPCLSLQR